MTKYNYRLIRQDLKNDILHNGYLIYGEEKYLKKQIVNSIIQKYVAPGMHDIDLIKISFDKQLSIDDINLIKQELQTPAFVSEKKIIVVEKSNLFARSPKGQSESHKKIQAEFDQVISLLNINSCLIFVEESIDGRQKKILQKWQKCGGVQVEIKHEELSVLRQWLQVKAQQKKIGLTVEAADSLIDRCESDMTQIEQEFDKALLYAEYTEMEGIDLSTIELVCRSDLRGTIFNLTDAVSAGRTRIALDILDSLLAQKEPLPLIRFMFTRHIRQLICAKELNNPSIITKQVGVYPFVARGLIKQSRNMNFADLEYMFKLCFESDYKVKQGHMSDRLAFETLLIEACLIFASKVS